MSTKELKKTDHHRQGEPPTVKRQFPQLVPQKKIVQEFVERVSTIPDVIGIVVTAHEPLLHIWTCLGHNIPREQEYAVYDVEADMLQKHAAQVPLEFESRTVLSAVELEEFLPNQHGYIAYQRERDAISDNASAAN